MKGKLRIGTVSGIGINVHWTLLVLLVWLFGMYLWRGATLGAALAGVGLIACLFGCVVFHELGHSLTARQFGIHTRDITLYPFGGIAMLTGRQMKPAEELWVAIAGPAVNVGIAAFLFLLTSVLDAPRAFDVVLLPGGFLATLMWMNIGLAAFNMIPAFPMDGGRVLRAGLATRMRYDRATQIAVFLGVVIAAVFVIVGLFELNPALVFVGIFVFLGASQESRLASAP